MPNFHLHGRYMYNRYRIIDWSQILIDNSYIPEISILNLQKPTNDYKEGTCYI